MSRIAITPKFKMRWFASEGRYLGRKLLTSINLVLYSAANDPRPEVIPKLDRRDPPVGVLPIIPYTGRLRPKGMPFSFLPFIYLLQQYTTYNTTLTVVPTYNMRYLRN